MDESKNIVLRPVDTDLSKLVDLIEAGLTPLCPVCKSRVVVVDTEEKMVANKSSRGAWCTLDYRHFSFYLSEKRRKK